MRKKTLFSYTTIQLQKALQDAGFDAATYEVVRIDSGFVIHIKRVLYEVSLAIFLWNDNVMLDIQHLPSKTYFFIMNVTELTLQQVVKLIQATISQHAQEEYEGIQKAIGVWQEPDKPINEPQKKES